MARFGRRFPLRAHVALSAGAGAVLVSGADVSSAADFASGAGAPVSGADTGAVAETLAVGVSGADSGTKVPVSATVAYVYSANQWISV